LYHCLDCQSFIIINVMRSSGQHQLMNFFPPAPPPRLNPHIHFLIRREKSSKQLCFLSRLPSEQECVSQNSVLCVDIDGTSMDVPPILVCSTLPNTGAIRFQMTPPRAARAPSGYSRPGLHVVSRPHGEGLPLELSLLITHFPYLHLHLHLHLREAGLAGIVGESSI
jgi:hypothetical protein